MTSVKIVLVKGRSDSNGAYPLVVQVIHSRKKKCVYTSYSVAPSQFDSKSRRVLMGGVNSTETVRRKAATARTSRSCVSPFQTA